MGKIILVYDIDCGPCAEFKRVVDLLDIHERIEYMSLTDADERGLLESLPFAQRIGSFHLILPQGELLSGAKAIPTLMAALPIGRVSSWLVASAPGGIASVTFVYSVFSRLHSSGSCQSGPQTVGRRAFH